METIVTVKSIFNSGHFSWLYAHLSVSDGYVNVTSTLSDSIVLYIDSKT